jgi:NADPH-dependent 2,4-dienoyl-CoA reductase/sulfur reductase-like enzyme
MKNSAPIVIVGASIAGVSAAEVLCAQCDEPILLIDADPHEPYDRTALSKGMLKIVDASPDIQIRTRQALEAQGITLRLGAIATGLDVAAKEVALANGERIAFSRLLIATGSSPVVPFPVTTGARVHVLRSFDDAFDLRASMAPGRHIAVIGAGLIGCEIASTARDCGLEVTVITGERGPFAQALGMGAARFVEALQQRAGVRTIVDAQVKGVRLDEAAHIVQLANGTEIRADLVVAGTGVIPSTAWLENSPVSVDRGVLCDSYFRTSVPGIYAAGDVARWPGGLDGALARVEHWTSAAEQGAAAARALLEPERPPSAMPLPYFMTELHGHRMQVVGYTAAADENRLVVASEGDDRPLILYRKGDRVIGCLAVGRPKAAANFNAMIGSGGTWDEALLLAQRLVSTVAVPNR